MNSSGEPIRLVTVGALPADDRHAGMSTCPLCQRHWLVTPHEDCMLPACGCFGFDYSADNPSRPCTNCGIRHAWTCEKRGS